MKQLLQVCRSRASRRGNDSVWAHPDVRLVVPARALSLAGDGMALVALLLRLHDTGHGPAAVTGLFLCFTAPTVLVMGLAGHVADTRDSRLVLGAATAAQVLACVGLALSAGLVTTYGFVVLLQLGVAFSTPAWSALLPRIVGEEGLGRVIALQQGLGAVTQPAGAALGGVVYGWFGAATAFWCDAGTFAVLLGVALAVRTRRGGRRDVVLARPTGSVGGAVEAATGPGDGRRALAGLRVLHADAVLWPLFCVLLPFILIVEGVNVVEVFLVRDALHATPGEYGVSEVAFGVGGVVGSMVAGRVAGDRRRARTMLGGFGLMCLAIAGCGLAPAFGVYLLLAVAVGATNAAGNAASGALTMTRTPDAHRGRVSAAMNGCARLASTVALVAGGVVGSALGPRPTFVLGGALGAVVITGGALRLRARTRRGTAYRRPAAVRPSRPDTRSESPLGHSA